MNSPGTATPIGLPALSPVQAELMNVLGAESVDERSVARSMSTDVIELRTLVAKLARHLDLPEQDTAAKEFSQLVRHAARFAKARAEATQRDRQRPSGSNVVTMALTQWQGKLAEVAAAVAKGVFISVDPYKIRPMYGQPRDYFPEEEQGSLEDSLGLVGQIQDVIIRKKMPPKQGVTDAPQFETEERVWRMADTEFELCDGERRWRGAMAKGLLEIRAKLIDIDDEGAYLVAAVSNFNHVGHTTLERARNIERLMKGTPPFPIEVIAAMQGISKTTAEKLLNTLLLPTDIHLMMHPAAQRAKGEDVLGKTPSYEIARLASNPVLHEHARDLARRYVQREIKLPQVRAEVDLILSRSGTSRDVTAERHQPARRLHLAERKLILAIDSMQEVKGRLADLKEEGVLPDNAKGLVRDLNRIGDLVTSILEIIGAKKNST